MMTDISVIHVANFSSLLILSSAQQPTTTTTTTTTTTVTTTTISAASGTISVHGNSSVGSGGGSASSRGGTTSSSAIIITSTTEGFPELVGGGDGGGYGREPVPALPELMEPWAYVASAVALFFIGFFGFFLNLFVIALMCKDVQVRLAGFGIKSAAIKLIGNSPEQ